MRIDESRQSQNVEDQRNRSFGGGRGMKFGLGTIVLIVIGYFLGINPLTMMGLIDTGQQMMPADTPQVGTGPVADEEGKFVAVVLGETEEAWGTLFQQGGAQYPPPRLVLFRGQVQSACGFASAAVGPFYCPGDQKVYIDLGFFNELENKLGAGEGDFGRAYVLAHEVGHHVQNVLGTERQLRQAQRGVSEAESNALQVRMELQADCYAGLWANYADRTRGIIETGDIDEGLRAAAAVGDDTIQKRMQGYVVPESFTHGTAEQRRNWFMRGYQSGDLAQCDTFSAGTL